MYLRLSCALVIPLCYWAIRFLRLIGSIVLVVCFNADPFIQFVWPRTMLIECDLLKLILLRAVVSANVARILLNELYVGSLFLLLDLDLLSRFIDSQL